MECELQPSLTARALKKVLPPRAITTRDARTTLNSAASMFTLYLSSVAQDHSAMNKRQTIILKDVLQALRDMDLEHFVGPIEDCVRETKAATALRKTKGGAEKAAAAGGAGDGDDNDEAMASVEEDENDDEEIDDDAEDAEDADAHEEVSGGEEAADGAAETGEQDAVMADEAAATTSPSP